MQLTRSVFAFAASAGLVLSFGCGDTGPKRHALSGAVTYKGRPIKGGLISFIPKGGQVSAAGAPITDGRYAIPAATGLLAGEYDVSISVPTAAPGKSETKGDDAPGGGGEKETAETLPAKYNATTELHVEVKAGGPNEFDFDLK